MPSPTTSRSRPKQTAFDGYVARLLNSRNPQERDSVYLGYTLHHQYPVLLPIELLFEHMHIVGGTGTGKTALGLTPLLIQLVRRNDGPVIVIDLKLDRAMFHTLRIESEQAGRKFKWFTTKADYSSYIFNPWGQSHLKNMSFEELIGQFLLSLNMHYGDDYGRAYFSLEARNLLQDAVRQMLSGPVANGEDSASLLPASFAELEETIRHLSRTDSQYQSGKQLANVLATLNSFPQLNLSRILDASTPATRHAIDMGEAIREKQVLYFSMPAVTDLTSASEIARLVLYSALTAAIDHREQTGQRPRVYLVCDEAQNLIAQNIANVLAQAREHGLACVLAHQSMDQLNPPGGVDLRQLVLSCTSVKQFFSARDPDTQDLLAKLSGEVEYYSASWQQTQKDTLASKVGLSFAQRPNLLEEPAVSISSQVGPRLTSEDIKDFNRQSNTSMLSVERFAGLCCFEGVFPIHTDWVMPQEEYRHRNETLAWPDLDDETVASKTVSETTAPQPRIARANTDAPTPKSRPSSKQKSSSKKKKTLAKSALASSTQASSTPKPVKSIPPKQNSAAVNKLDNIRAKRPKTKRGGKS